MAEFRPNEAQARAIQESGKNILVSAGAGSGKTTVLVERVLRMIIEEGVDIDSLIIVTFTRAAAAHMKEKIYNRIRSAIEDDNVSEEKKEHLKVQLMRVFSARICTIDSLCMEIVRENFQSVDIDPGFRVADEAEITLLMQDVLSQMIEDHYAEPTDSFLEFVSYYTDKNDAKLEDIILTMYRFSQSHPEPERWLLQAVGPYIHAGRFGEVENEEENKWIYEFGKEISAEIRSLIGKAERGLAVCDKNYGPYAYMGSFEKVLAELETLYSECFNDKVCHIEEILKEWGRLPSVKKGDEVDEDLKKAGQGLYGEIKESLKKLQDRYFYQPLEDMFADMGKCSGIAKTIAKLTLEFTRKFAAEKKARLIADFDDVSHFALGVLIRRNEDGELEYTEAADSIAQATKEIIVDEYQDTNRLQDELIKALSAERFGRPNVFMVGDVKQSIYGFRLACPDLFIKKYNAYQDPEGNGMRIILGENYRSRKEIVDYINYIFEKIMLPDIGGIDYLDGNTMVAGAKFPEYPEPEKLAPEILFIDGSGDSGKDAESYEITKKIEEITENFYVTDEDGSLRKARYSDIAILTRKTNNPRLEKMLTDRHIPVRKSSSKGFFGSFEIRLAMDLLKITDNPLQDIPLAAVLLSPLAGLDANSLARIRTAGTKDVPLYQACLEYIEGRSDKTAEALSDFLSRLKRWNTLSESFEIRKMLDLLIEESGLMNCCEAMTYGEGRAANLEFLKGLAESFSKGSYTGLFNFIRYIEAVQKADKDFGSGQTSGGGDAVTMMTIHKSKGLEFPIVILADCGKQISDLESSSPVYLDDTLGIGIENRNLDTRIRKKTLIMESIALKKKTSLLAEEIRLLYVAMSRAKEKLIITGAKGSLSARIREWENPDFLPDTGSVRSDNSYMYLLGDAMRCRKEDDAAFQWEVKEFEEVEIERAFEVFGEKETRERIEEVINFEAEAKSPERTDELAKAAGIYDFAYPYLSATKANVKVTASQLENHETDREKKEENPKNFLPGIDGGLTGAERGNAYHKLFELLDYKKADSVLTSHEEESTEAVSGFAVSEIERLRLSGYLTEDASAAIDPEKISRFLLSGIGTRIRKAALSGTLKREQQFVMSAEIDGNPDGLLQGIIDALFIEEGEAGKEAVLVDYKTDRQKEEEYFIKAYKDQQDAYAKAIEAATGIPIKEKILYSVELEKEIYLR